MPLATNLLETLSFAGQVRYLLDSGRHLAYFAMGLKEFHI
jgi:hypothetical protein